MHCKSKKHLLTTAIALSIVLVTPAFAQAANITPPAKGASPTVDAIRDAGTLKVGVAILAPWILQDPSTKQYIGPAAIVAKDAAKALGVKLQYVSASWDTIVAGLISHKYQLAAAALFETPARAKVINFATFDHSGTCYLVKPDSPIKSLSDINKSDNTYLGYTGYATAPLFHKKYPKARQKLVSPPPGSTPRVPDLVAGRGNIVPIDSPLVYWLTQRYKGKVRTVRPVDECFTKPDLVRPIGVGYAKGDKAFGKFLNAVIKANEAQIAKAKKMFAQPKWLDARKD